MRSPPMAHLQLFAASWLTDALLEDQRSSELCSLANLTLSCDDGRVPVHRCIFTNALPGLFDLLKEQDLSEPSFIHFDGYCLGTILHFVELIYTGNTVIPSEKEHLIPLHNLMKMLKFPENNVQLKEPRINPPESKVKLRYARNNELQQIDEQNDDQLNSNEGRVEDNKENKNNGRKVDRNMRSAVMPAPPKRGIAVRPPPRPAPGRKQTRLPSYTREQSTEASAKSMEQISKTVIAAPRVVEHKLVNGWIKSTECISCKLKFKTEKDLVDHLRLVCAPTVKDFFNYDRKCCRVCEQSTFADIWELLRHAQACMNWKSRPGGSSMNLETTVEPTKPALRSQSKKRRGRPVTSLVNKRRKVIQNENVIKPRKPDVNDSNVDQSEDSSADIPNGKNTLRKGMKKWMQSRPSTNSRPRRHHKGDINSSPSPTPPPTIKLSNPPPVAQPNPPEIIPPNPPEVIQLPNPPPVAQPPNPPLEVVEPTRNQEPPFPLEFANGEWKFVMEQQRGNVMYGVYQNRAGKIMGVPASQAKGLK